MSNRSQNQNVEVVDGPLFECAEVLEKMWESPDPEADFYECSNNRSNCDEDGYPDVSGLNTENSLFNVMASGAAERERLFIEVTSTGGDVTHDPAPTPHHHLSVFGLHGGSNGPTSTSS